MARLSARLESKLNARLARTLPDPGPQQELDGLLGLAGNPLRFDSPSELRQHLREGALLAVGVVASRALSIPQGEYVVWTTNHGNTVLVPTGAARGGDVVVREAPQYELHTSRLLGSWNRLSRTIAERDDYGGRHQHHRDREQQDQDHYATPPSDMPEGPYTFGSKVSRNELWQAMKDRNMGATELADAVGVDKSTISRLLRKVHQGKEEPGGRNPSAEVAMKISRVLGVPIELVMPPESELIGKKRSGTTGSGKQGTMGHSRNGIQVGQDNPAESLQRQLWLARLEYPRQLVRAATLLARLGPAGYRSLGEAIDRSGVLAEAGVTSRVLGLGARAAAGVGSGMQRLSNHLELGDFRKAIKVLSRLQKTYGGNSPSFSKFISNVVDKLQASHDLVASRQPGRRQPAPEPTPQSAPEPTPEPEPVPQPVPDEPSDEGWDPDSIMAVLDDSDAEELESPDELEPVEQLG